MSESNRQPEITDGLQAEWCTRPLEEQGLFATVSKTTTHAAADDEATVGTDMKQQVQIVNCAHAYGQRPGHELAFAKLHNGACSLLYAPLQLHLHRRKLSQLHLLVVEEKEIRRSFNDEFDALRKNKAKILGKMEEQVQRIRSIQTELGASRYPADIVKIPEEEEANWIRIEPHELKAQQWPSPSQRCAG